MYRSMHILHGFWGYSLMGADYKLTIFDVRSRAGTFCADAQAKLMACTTVVYFSALTQLKPFPREAPRRLFVGFGI